MVICCNECNGPSGSLSAATAVSILLFIEGVRPSGIFPKKMPPRMIFKWQHVNRNRSSRYRIFFGCVNTEQAEYPNHLESLSANGEGLITCIEAER